MLLFWHRQSRTKEDSEHLKNKYNEKTEIDGFLETRAASRKHGRE